MIPLFVKLLPYLLLLYFLIRSLKQPIYLFGLPFLLFFRDCIFFGNVWIFTIPGRLSIDIKLLAWMMIVWLTIRYRSSNEFNSKDIILENKNRMNLMDYIVIGLMMISITNLILIYGEYSILDDVYAEFIILFSLFIGYFIIKDIIRHFSLPVLKEFLFTIVLINSIASCLYIIHQGLHYSIYMSEEFSSEIYMGEVITRTFWFAPVLWTFSVAYLFIFMKSKSFFSILLIIVNLLAIFISYTRSALLGIVFIILLYYLFKGIKKRNYGIIVKNIIITSIIGVLLFLAVSYFLPVNTNYFIDRFKELDKNSGNSQPNNLEFRFEQTGDVIDYIDAEKLIIGFGPVTEIQIPYVQIMKETTADSVWAGVIFRWGYVGLILFALLYIFSVIKAFNLFMKTEGILSEFGLFFLLIIISELIGSFVSWTFMSPSRFPMGLWYLGILSALLALHESTINSNEKELI